MDLGRRELLRGFAGTALLGALGSGCARRSHPRPTPPPLEVARTRCEIGENPMWHPDRRLIYFLDIAPGTVHAYDPATGTNTIFSRGPTTGGMLLHEDGRLVLLQDGRISILDSDGKQQVVREGLSRDGARFNDGIVDPEGRIFTGELGGEGRIMRFDLDGSRTILGSGYGVPNGWGFTRDLKHLYFTDSIPRKIYRFDYDEKTGSLSNRRVFAEIPKSQGVPDGMCVDAKGYVWTAVWFGGRIKRYSPDGRLDHDILFPVRQTSAVCFGGDDLADIYVTSSGTDKADELKPPGYDVTLAPRGGGLFTVRMKGVRGKAAFRSRVRF